MTDATHFALEDGKALLTEEKDKLVLEFGVEGMFRMAIADIVDKLTALGLTVVTDPRNARPGTVFVELPTFTAFTNQIADITVVVRVLAAPPGNLDAANWLLDRIDEIHASDDIAVIDGRPTLATLGTQELPAYDLTLRLASKRI